MSNEEAIQEIKSWTSILLKKGNNCTDKTAKAQDMAIKALQQQPCGEYICRTDLEKWLIDIRSQLIKPENYKTARELEIADTLLLNLLQLSKGLSSVYSIREKGEWIQVDDNKCKCNKCEIIHLIAQYPHGNINFCPNCGAEMESEVEE